MGTDNRVKRAYHLERDKESFKGLISSSLSHRVNHLLTPTRTDRLKISRRSFIVRLHLLPNNFRCSPPVRITPRRVNTPNPMSIWHSFHLLSITMHRIPPLGRPRYPRLLVRHLSPPDYALTGQHQSPSASSPIESTLVQHGWSVRSSFSFSNWDESDDQAGERASLDWSHASRASSRHRHLSSNYLQYFIAFEASRPEHARTSSPSK